MKDPKPETFRLPKIAYGPICLRILREFVSYHNIKDDFDYPAQGDQTHQALEKIFHIIYLSMNEDVRHTLLNEINAYYRDLPPSVL